MKPTASKTSWMVWTNDDVFSQGQMARNTWHWVVHGPLGSDSGVAETSEEAVQRCIGARMLLAAREEGR